MKIFYTLFFLCYSIQLCNAAISPGSIEINQKVCFGSKIHINEYEAASGITISATYIWQTSIDGIGAWSDISGATEISYTSSTPVTTNAYYRRLVKDDSYAEPDNIAISNVVFAIVTSFIPSVSIPERYDVDLCDYLGIISSSTNGGTRPSYIWKKNGINLGVTEIPSLMIWGIAEGDIFTCEMISSECQSSEPIVSNPMIAHVLPIPTIFISLINSGPLTSGQPVTLKVMSDDISLDFGFYSWYKNGKIVEGDTTILTTKYILGDTYTAQVRTGLCTAGYKFVSAPINFSSDFSTFIIGPVSVLPNQTGVTYSVPQKTGMLYEWTVSSDANIISGQGTHSIVVDFGTNTSMSNANQRVVSGFTIRVKETDANSVSSTIILESSTATDTQDGKLLSSLLVYPIPADDECYIEFKEASLSAGMSYTLFDSKGLLITKGVMNDTKIKIDMHSFPSGIYLFLIEMDGHVASKKIIKR